MSSEVDRMAEVRQLEMLYNQWASHCEIRRTLGKDKHHILSTEGGSATYRINSERTGIYCFAKGCQWSYVERPIG